jgi:hypothetical protein
LIDKRLVFLISARIWLLFDENRLLPGGCESENGRMPGRLTCLVLRRSNGIEEAGNFVTLLEEGHFETKDMCIT